MFNITEMYRGNRFEANGKEYICLDVDISDFSNSMAVGFVGFVKDTKDGAEVGAIPNADNQSVELAVFTGYEASKFNPRNPDEASGAAAATADGKYIFCVRGLCKGLVNGTSDVAADDPLEILKNTDNFVLNGTTGTSVWDAKTHAIAAEAVTADADTLALIYLRGGKVTPSAS